MATTEPAAQNTEDLLIVALKAKSKAKDELAAAMAKLKPLEDAHEERSKEVAGLMAAILRETGGNEPTAKRTGRGGKGVAKGPYTIDPLKKVEAVFKRTLTRLTNQGVPEPEAKKRAKATSEALKAKLGLK